MELIYKINAVLDLCKILKHMITGLDKRLKKIEDKLESTKDGEDAIR